MFSYRPKTDTPSVDSTGVTNAASVIKSDGRHVLLVTPSADGNSVLEAVLKRRGVTTSIAQDADDGLRLALAELPNVIVLDNEVASTPALSIEYCAVAVETGSEVIVLGKLPSSRTMPRSWVEIGKPYHYEALIRNIESRLRRRLAA